MNARRVNTQLKNTNRNKQPRNSPAASIGNHCNPTTSFSIDERFFRRAILPLAIANNWISKPNNNFIRINSIDNVINIPNRTYISFIISLHSNGAATAARHAILKLTFADNQTQNIHFLTSGDLYLNATRTMFNTTELISQTNIIKIENVSYINLYYVDILYEN
ncbi:MAG: hypothetical protein [Chaetfec virus UA24_3359]|nr:MAG: hypothetical protein [Chaetfec virus UA24_3359]